MNPRTEQRLRAAFEAKADQVTEERLERLAAQRQQYLLDGETEWAEVVPAGLALFEDGAEAGDDPTPLELHHRVGTSRHARWLAPALAAAAVAAIAVAVTAVATSSSNGKHAPNPPATQVTSPSPSSSPSASTSTPAPSTAVAGPPYLPRGQQGTRAQVPWSAVGTGWRLLKPSPDTGKSPTSLYLYDPAGGRYLITDRLPAKAGLLAWSPDGTRAMVGTTTSDGEHYQELNLRSGQLSAGFTRRAGFVTYTQPKGLAAIFQERVDGVVRLARYSTTGRLEHAYAPDLPGLGKMDAINALYLPDGGSFVSALVQGPMVLISNNGHPVRTYQVPNGYGYCYPVKRWTDTSVLERCERLTGAAAYQGNLYLQPVSGGAPTLLTPAMGWDGRGYFDAWPVSNGHVLLRGGITCDSGNYDILLSVGGGTRPLRGPAGLASSAPIVNVDADLVTFEKRAPQDCGWPGKLPRQLVDYNMITGATDTLTDGLATVVSWPGDPS